MKNVKSEPLGQLLKRYNYITEEQLQKALNLHKGSNRRLGEVLVDNGFVKEKDLVQVLEFKLGIPHVDLSQYVLDPDLVDYIPEKLARLYKVLPLEKNGNNLSVAMVNPMDVVAIDDLKKSCKLIIKPYIASGSEVMQSIEQLYSMKDSSLDEFDSFEAIEDEEEDIEDEKLQTMVSDAPIIRLTSHIITKAIQQRASDVHIEPQERLLKIRYRIDGVLTEVMRVSMKSHLAIISRFKIMSNLDIAERRRPQDGRIQINYRGNAIDIRVSTMTTVNGEKIVMRILNKGDALLNLEELGFAKSNLKKYRKLIQEPHGIILVTGPTGSGKSTTLISALNEINSHDLNITSVEDPVEYRVNGINQVQVNRKAGIEYANSLRAILRQDPDVIMIGEIRDLETGQIAIRAALTGHLVLSTLHTNEAAASMMRLVDMGIKPYLVASSVIGVMAQRLIRKLCSHCKEEYEPTKDIYNYLGIKEGEPLKLYQGNGCVQCNNTGYRGRTAIHEVLMMSNTLRDLIHDSKTTVEELKNKAIEEGMMTLSQDGKEKILQGITTPEEIMRVTVGRG